MAAARAESEEAAGKDKETRAVLKKLFSTPATDKHKDSTTLPAIKSQAKSATGILWGKPKPPTLIVPEDSSDYEDLIRDALPSILKSKRDIGDGQSSGESSRASTPQLTHTNPATTGR